jgi:hypothetical protein
LCTFAPIFLVLKYIFTKEISEKDIYKMICPSAIIIGITIFKLLFFFGILGCFYQLSNGNIDYENRFSIELLRIISIVYTVYFPFSIIYYFTLSIYVHIRNYINYAWFFIIGIIYIIIANLILYLVISPLGNEKFNATLLYLISIIICSLEVIFLNIGVSIALCRNDLNNETKIKNTINIEVYKLFPLLIIFSIPGLIAFVMLAIFSCGFCYFCRNRY